MHYEGRGTREDLGIPSVLPRDLCTRVCSRLRPPLCLYRTRIEARLYLDIQRCVRTIRRKSRDARSHGPPEATWIDRRTSRTQSHYVRERNGAGLHGQFNGDPDLLSVFNDQQSAANHQNGSINPLWSLDTNGTRVIRERFFSIRNDINPGQRLLLAFLAMFFLFSDTENRHDSAYRACAALAISGNYTPKTWDRSYCFFKVRSVERSFNKFVKLQF